MVFYTVRLVMYSRFGLATDAASLAPISIAVPGCYLAYCLHWLDKMRPRSGYACMLRARPSWLVMFALLSLLSVLSVPTNAEFSRGLSYQPRPETSRYEQRKQYQDIIYWIKTGQRSRYLKARDQLRTYPLYPYLEYTDKIYRLSRQSPDAIMAFIEQYGDTPLANQLRQNWLFSLAKRGKWQLFLEYYDIEGSTGKNACSYGYALSRQGRLQEALDHAAQLWLVDFSQPDECDSVFKVWQDNGGLAPEIAWKRYSMVLQANKVDLARYLTRFLSREDKKFASSYLLVHRRPANITRLDKFKAQNPRTREIVLHGVKRLSRSKPDQALDTLVKYESVHTFETQSLTEAYVYIGKKLANSADDKNQIEDLPVNLHDHPDLAEARIRLALRKADFSQVLILINTLPRESRKQAVWQYWKARALIDSVGQADRDIAINIFVKLAEARTFYGFLSADYLQQDYNFVDEPSAITTEEILALEETPGIQRALELLAMNERNRARREWYFTTRDFSSRENKIAARVALKWGWYKPAIQSLIEAKAWNDLEHRFPIAYPDEFISNARVADIPVFWSFAIARQESAFMPDAKSPVGAYGLMQLMPATARSMARRTGVKLRYNRELTDPSLNIKLGSEYLGRMLRRYENNRIFASAAYNAGPANVDKWLNPELALDVWIETIPFTETRNYVKNILMFSTIYGRLLKQNQPLIYRHEFDDFSPPMIVAPQKSLPGNATPHVNSMGIEILAPNTLGEIENTNASE